MIKKYEDFEYISEDYDIFHRAYSIVEYITFPFIREAYGIPNILKEVFTQIWNEIDIANKTTYHFSFNYDSFKIKNLIIEFIDIPKNIDIYGLMDFNSNNPIITIQLDFKSYNKTNLKKSILHELLHLYEVIKRYENKSKMGLQWSLGSIMSLLRKKYNDPFIQFFCNLLYWSLDHELNSRVAETYIILMDKLFPKNNPNKDINPLEHVLQKTLAWKIHLNLSNVNLTNHNINYKLLMQFFIDLNSQINIKANKNHKMFKIPTNINDVKTLLSLWQKFFIKKGDYLEKKLLKLKQEISKDLQLLETAKIDFDKKTIGYEKIAYRNYQLNKLLK